MSWEDTLKQSEDEKGAARQGEIDGKITALIGALEQDFEKLKQWRQDRDKGQHNANGMKIRLDEIIRLLNEVTSMPKPNPVYRARSNKELGIDKPDSQATKDAIAQNKPWMV
jgi:hypothetical protein